MASSSIQSIFISYSREDVAGARELREWLLTHGRQPWMDLFDIPAGARWPDEIDAALRSSDATIGLMSPSSLASENVKNEWDWAIANNRRLILLLVEPCDVPFHYVSRNYIDFTGDREAGYRALDAALVRKPAQAQPDSVDTTANARGDAPARTSHAFTSPGTGTRLRRAMSRRRSVSLLVGRDREQRRLTDILDSAVCGSGGLVLLGGEAGIGKTTLTRWLQAQAEQQGALVLSGGCYDLATTPPYGPWVEILRVYQPEGGLPPIPAQIRDDAGLASIPSRAALFEIVGEFFAEVSEHRPLVLVLEDLHWADQATLDLLRFFARFLPGLPSLTVATYRDDELTRRHPLSELLPLLAREDGASRLTLRRLDLAETRSLLRERYQLPEHEEDQLVTHLQQLSEGNPFFASEVLNTLEEQSVLRRTDDGWQLSELSDIAVPPLLRQVIEGRLQRLDPDTRTPLEIAAIIGQDVPIDLWQQVSGLASDEVSAAMTEAIDANLLEESADGMSLTFRHALIREALYAGVAPLQRRDRHRAVAEALFDEPHPDPDAVLTHLEHAHDPRALEWLARAGDRAMSRFAWDVAIERYGRALELIERQSQPDARQHCEILLALGEAQNQVAAGRPTAGSHLVLGAGGSYAGRDTFWRAAGIARSAGLPEHLARAALGVVGFNPHPQQGGPEGIDLLEEALAHLPTGDSDLRVRLLARLGTDPYIQAAYHGTRPLTTELAEQLRQRSDEAVAMARRLGNPAALGYALAMRGLRPILHSHDELLAIADEIVSLATGYDDLALLCWGLTIRQRILVIEGEMAAAREALDNLSEAVRRLQLPFFRWSLAIHESGDALRLGKFADAQLWLDRADDIQPISGAGTIGRVTLYRELGRFDEAMRLIDRFSKSPMMFHFSSGLRILCLLDTGQFDEARSEYQRVMAHELIDPLQLRSLSWFAEAAIVLGRADWIEPLYDHMLPAANQNLCSNSTDNTGGSVSYHLGLLATVMSRWDAAEQHFSDALRMNREWNIRPYIAHTLHAWAEMLTRRNQPGDRALALLDEALALADEIGMARLIDQSTSLRARLEDHG